jgi:glutamate synthase (NADPH/NADH) large chain
MMRKCHLNTCPVGVATQDPVLRKRFRGTPEHVINYFFFVAEEVRELMAAMGVRSLNNIVGASHWLDQEPAISHWKANGLDFTRLFAKPDVEGKVAVRHCESQDHKLDRVLDRFQHLARPGPDVRAVGVQLLASGLHASGDDAAWPALPLVAGIPGHR